MGAVVRAKVGEGPVRVGRVVGWLRRIHWRVEVGMDILGKGIEGDGERLGGGDGTLGKGRW